MTAVAHAESAGGLAFEVQIKSSEGAAAMTPGRARLESYAAAGGEKLPRLLRAAAEELEKAAQKRDASLAEKSSKATKHCQEVQAKVGHCLGEREAQAGALQRSLEEGLEKAAQKRDASLADKSSKATKYGNDVQTKADQRREQMAASIAEQARSLEKDLEEAAQRRNSALADKSTKAATHCQSVQAKAESSQTQQADAAKAQLCRYEAGLTEAAQRREMRLAQIRSEAGQHCKTVQAKVSGLRQHQARASELSAVVLERRALHVARSVVRSAKAGSHNKKVAEALARRQQCAEDRKEELSEQLQAVQRRAATNAAAADPAARGERARQHNAEVVRKRGAQREAQECKVQALRRKLQRKGLLAESVAQVRKGLPAKSVAKVPVTAEVAAEAGGSRAVIETRSQGTWLKWLAALLPCAKV